MAGCKVSKCCDNKPVVRTGGEVFPDGGMLELVRIPTGEVNLLAWNGKSAKTAEQFVRHGETFAPLRIDPTILRLLHLPGDTAACGSTRELFTDIAALISRATQGAADVAQLVTFLVLATWLVDALPLAPTMWIVCPPTAAAAPLLQVLRLICRRALAVNDISIPGIHALTDLRPTVLTEVFQPTRGLLNLLRASTRSGAFMARGGRFVDARCAKVVFAPEPLRDPESAGFPLELVLPPARDYVPLLSAAEAERIAQKFQAKLLHYRLLNWSKVRTPAFDLGPFTPSMRDLAYSLGACVCDDNELQARLVPLLTPLDIETRTDHASLLAAIVLEVLLARCHAHTGQYLPVTELTAGVNTLLLGRGETFEVSPEKVGWVLRALGLRTSFIPRGRKGLSLSQEVREQIHKLAAAYGVRTLRGPSATIECALCATLTLPWKPEADPGSAIADPA